MQSPKIDLFKFGKCNQMLILMSHFTFQMKILHKMDRKNKLKKKNKNKLKIKFLQVLNLDLIMFILDIQKR